MRQISRADHGGSGIDRGQPVSFTFNQFRLEGFQGDTVASALLSSDPASPNPLATRRTER